jgi:DNA repair protein RadC
LKAVFGLAKKLLGATKAELMPIISSKEAYLALIDLFYGEKQEVLAVLLLDPKLKPIHREIISRGILTEVLVHPREVFAPALQHRAHSIIIAHNHPSGDVTPSGEDIRLTRLLKTSGEILNIKLADHIIFAGQAYFSLKDHKLL